MIDPLPSLIQSSPDIMDLAGDSTVLSISMASVNVSTFRSLPVLPSQAGTPNLNSLLIGMMYNLLTQTVQGLQHLHDGLRCASLEDDLHHTVHTIDLGHEPHLAIESRYIRDDFTDDGVLAKMDNNLPGLIFPIICSETRLPHPGR